MNVVKKILRGLNRPFKLLSEKVNAKFQRSVLKTVQRNPAVIREIVAGMTSTADSIEFYSNPELESLLLAFTRSIQRNQTRNSASPTLIEFNSISELQSTQDRLAKLLTDCQSNSFVLRVGNSRDTHGIGKICAKFESSHTAQVFMSGDKGDQTCICLLERKAA